MRDEATGNTRPGGDRLAMQMESNATDNSIAPDTIGVDQAFLPAELSPAEPKRCLLCGGCTNCGETKPCSPCECDGVEGVQTAVCDRGGPQHAGRRYPWIAYSRQYGDILLQQFCEEHMLMGMKRATRHALTSWLRGPTVAPAAWTGAPVPRL